MGQYIVGIEVDENQLAETKGFRNTGKRWDNKVQNAVTEEMEGRLGQSGISVLELVPFPLMSDNHTYTNSKGQIKPFRYFVIKYRKNEVSSKCDSKRIHHTRRLGLSWIQVAQCS